MSFDPTQVRAGTAALVQALPAVEWITDARVERLSQDFYWFSPVLKRELEGLRADAVARPKTEDEIRAVVAGCARRGLPVTVRGSGTGNYGQCMPLHGGVILDLSAYNRLLWHRGGVARAQAGIRMMEMDRQTQQGVEGPDGRRGRLGTALRAQHLPQRHAGRAVRRRLRRCRQHQPRPAGQHRQRAGREGHDHRARAEDGGAARARGAAAAPRLRHQRPRAGARGRPGAGTPVAGGHRVLPGLRCCDRVRRRAGRRAGLW